MASFSKEIYAKYKKFDYDGVIKNFDWITTMIKELFDDIIEPYVQIAFTMGDIDCSCNSINEFKEHAYGQNISVYTYNVSFYQNTNDEKIRTAFMILSDYKEKQIKVCCDDKQTLIKICTALENSLSAQEEKQPILLQQTVNRIDQSTNISIGDNNTIQDSNIGAGNQLQKEEHSEKDSFWNPIWQTLVANWMWFLLGLGVAALLTYFGFNNTDWMNVF